MTKCETRSAALIARLVANALREELETYPKPGLVSLVDCGSHPDMDAECFLSSISVLEPYFAEMAAAGARDCDLAELQRIGLAAEAAMMKATNGRNTYRGAIFCLGLLAAAAGRQSCEPLLSLGEIVAQRWGTSIPLPAELPASSNGLAACHRYKLGGVRAEARQGFPSVFKIAFPLFQTIAAEVGCEAARVHVFFTLLELCEDTTLLKRGGLEGRDFATAEAHRFLQSGGVRNPGWMELATSIHHAFVQRNLTAGGVADLLAATIFVHSLPQSP